MYEINHGLGPHFKELLNNSLKMSNIHVYSFDESLNEATQTCEMDLYERFWDVNVNKVNVRYYGSSLMGHTTHRELLTHLNGVVKDLDHNKL